MIRVQIACLALVGCGVPDSLPEMFREKSHCQVPGVTFAAETKIDCAQVAANLETAKRYVRRLGYYTDDLFDGVEVRIWNRQLLYCDQYFLGACVHFLKGEAENTYPVRTIELNNGGELLLHEFLHFAVNDRDHVTWGRRGFTFADQMYRAEVGWLR